MDNKDKTPSEDLSSKFDEMVRLVETERAKMKAEVEVYNAEKERMKSLNVSDDDILNLNVGGQKFMTKRSTLCQVEGSLLACMFSGRWEDGLARDESGCPFLDFNPKYFACILDYLRAKTIATEENPVQFPQVSERETRNFNILVGYLGLHSERLLSDYTFDVMFDLHSEGIVLEGDGKVAVRGPANGHEYVLSRILYKCRLVRQKMKLESFQNNHWLLVGIVRQSTDVLPTSKTSYTWPGSYGWALGDTGQAYKAGVVDTSDQSFKNTCKQGEMIELIVNVDAGQLSLILPDSQHLHIDIPRAEKWRLHVNLWGKNDKVRILH